MSASKKKKKKITIAEKHSRSGCKNTVAYRSREVQDYYLPRGGFEPKTVHLSCAATWIQPPTLHVFGVEPSRRQSPVYFSIFKDPPHSLSFHLFRRAMAFSRGPRSTPAWVINCFGLMAYIRLNSRGKARPIKT